MVTSAIEQSQTQAPRYQGPSPVARRPGTLHCRKRRVAMGLLVEGVWRDDSFDTKRFQDGRFVRPQTRFRNWITPDGSAGPSGEGGFPAEAGRYHLYVSLACPW